MNRIEDHPDTITPGEWAASVNDIPDAELLRRCVGRKGHGRKEPRWVRVMDRFLLGSTYARQLCRRYGFDPDEKVGS